MKYWAFISYSHKDRRAADRLHRALESYRLPLKQIGKQNSGGEPFPRRLTPIFIDRAELASSSSLAGTLHPALRDSRFLIVLCSPAARASSYVEEEILEFQKIGRQAQILAVIADWGPRHAVQDVFPRPLCRDDEPLAADLEKDGFHNAKRARRDIDGIFQPGRPVEADGIEFGCLLLEVYQYLCMDVVTRRGSAPDPTRGQGLLTG